MLKVTGYKQLQNNTVTPLRMITAHMYRKQRWECHELNDQYLLREPVTLGASNEAVAALSLLFCTIHAYNYLPLRWCVSAASSIFTPLAPPLNRGFLTMKINLAAFFNLLARNVQKKKKKKKGDAK